MRSSSNRPPASASFIAALFVSPKRREGHLGCLEENFHANCKRFGRTRAVLLYWRDALESLPRLAWQATQRIGVVAAFLRWIA
jgi:hypothetical protein